MYFRHDKLSEILGGTGIVEYIIYINTRHMEKKYVSIDNDGTNDELLREAFNNSFRFLFEGVTLKELKKECVSQDKDLVMTVDTETGGGLDNFLDMLIWYEDEEWYERCAVIRDFIKKQFPENDM